MAKIDELTFGSIIFEDKRYRRDIMILTDGTAKKGKGGFPMFSSHEIRKRELEELSQCEPELIIMGTGTSGALV